MYGDDVEDDATRVLDEDEDARLRDNNVNVHGCQGMPSPVLVGLMLSELTVMANPIGSTAVTTASM